MSTHTDDFSDDDDLAFPAPATPEKRAARAAREKVRAADRARRWREDQRQAGAVDAAIVAGLARAFARGTVGQVEGEIPVTSAGVSMKTIISQSVKAFRAAGGSFEDGKRLIGARLQGSLAEVARGP